MTLPEEAQLPAPTAPAPAEEKPEEKPEKKPVKKPASPPVKLPVPKHRLTPPK